MSATQPTLPFAIAHRGASGTAPENTLVAIRRAATLGATWVEIDATATADGEAVLHHDDTIDRCSDGSGLLLAHTLSALAERDFGAWFDPRFAGERLAHLRDAAALCAELGLGCNLEIKVTGGWDEPTARAVCDIAADWPTAHSPLLISSFSERALQVAAARLPAVPRALLVDIPPENWRARLDDTASTALHCANTPLVSRARLAPVLDAGFPVRVYTVDDPARAEALRTMGVSSVFTNHPERFATEAAPAGRQLAP
ncbi:MAG: glycerophosphodiester phosphodiesterase family protein [Pseudomonadota bacterium]